MALINTFSSSFLLLNFSSSKIHTVHHRRVHRVCASTAEKPWSSVWHDYNVQITVYKVISIKSH